MPNEILNTIAKLHQSYASDFTSPAQSDLWKKLQEEAETMKRDANILLACVLQIQMHKSLTEEDVKEINVIEERIRT